MPQPSDIPTADGQGNFTERGTIGITSWWWDMNEGRTDGKTYESTPRTHGCNAFEGDIDRLTLGVTGKAKRGSDEGKGQEKVSPKEEPKKWNQGT
eukprot:scaffold24_cov341-Pavlova_lutheri.AAC.20